MRDYHLGKLIATTAFLAGAACDARAQTVRYPYMDVQGDILFTQVRPDQYIAVDLKQGRVLWKFEEIVAKTFSSPAFVGQWLVVVAEKQSTSELLGFRDGVLHWRIDADAEPMIGHSSPVSCGEHILVVDWLEGIAKSLSPSTGAVNWRRGGPENRFIQPPAVHGSSSAVYLSQKGSETSEVTELDCQSGEVLQKFAVSGYWSTILLGRGHVILIRTIYHGGADVAAFDLRRKATIWQRHITDLARNRPIITGDLLVLVDERIVALALDTGRILYRKEIEYRPGTAVAGEKLVLQTGEREISEVDLRSHKTTWRTILPFAIVSNPVIHGASVYARTDNGRLVEISGTTGELLGYIQLE
jgi:outer membrane protein assembly factor BamB